MPNLSFLAALMDTIPDRIYFKDREGRFLSVNRAFLDFLGLGREEELRGKTDFDIFLPEHAEPARRDEQAVLASGEALVGKVEKEALPDGRVHWVSTTKVPLRDAATGAVIGTCGISRDITEEHRRHRRIEEELLLAQQIQTALLPSRHPSFPPGAGEEENALPIAHRYLPMGRVGGDFFAVLPVSAAQAGVLICDVMGHGVHAALVTAIQRVLVDGLLPLAGDPGAFLAELNRRLHGVLGGLAGPLFVTALHAVVDARDGGVRFASAGHPLPLVVGPGGTARPLGSGREPVPPAAPPLGVVGDAAYAARDDRLAVGEHLLLYTDGLSDLDSAPERAGLPELAARCAGASPAGGAPFLDLLLDKARRLAGEDGFADDVCVVALTLRQLLPPAAGPGLMGRT